MADRVHRRRAHDPRATQLLLAVVRVRQEERLLGLSRWRRLRVRTLHLRRRLRLRWRQLGPRTLRRRRGGRRRRCHRFGDSRRGQVHDGRRRDRRQVDRRQRGRRARVGQRAGRRRHLEVVPGVRLQEDDAVTIALGAALGLVRNDDDQPTHNREHEQQYARDDRQRRDQVPAEHDRDVDLHAQLRQCLEERRVEREPSYIVPRALAHRRRERGRPEDAALDQQEALDVLARNENRARHKRREPLRPAHKRLRAQQLAADDQHNADEVDRDRHDEQHDGDDVRNEHGRLARNADHKQRVDCHVKQAQRRADDARVVRLRGARPQQDVDDRDQHQIPAQDHEGSPERQRRAEPRVDLARHARQPVHGHRQAAVTRRA
eukprot:Unigene14861_Nuclearia_a/m.44642 Unigene14861_Nuclearia_a/g.44642  ORF Unigene14861_Nuclearia_a/g.44642 Unigene14861_Nuclearia_a/m.44642 type:complete len:376 (-) Unigene14861_Nuclearia_a:1688-2815(-)